MDFSIKDNVDANIKVWRTVFVGTLGVHIGPRTGISGRWELQIRLTGYGDRVYRESLAVTTPEAEGHADMIMDRQTKGER